MALITRSKHAQSRFNQHVGAALATMLLPAAALAQTTPAPQTMAEVKIVGSAENDYKADRASSAKYTEALVDTAQTIQVIKKEVIQQQGAVTLTEALRNSPGVGAFFLGENGSTNTGDAVYMRGFDTSGSIYVDGVRDIGSISRDVFNIEQVDVLKGPAGTDNGRSAPTGSINLVSKQPTMENAFFGTVMGGSGSQKRVAADYNVVLNAETGTAIRLNAMVQDSGNPARDQVKNKRWGFAPTVAFGLGGKTRVYVDLLHVKQDNIPDGGVSTIGLPGYTSPDPLRPYIANAPMVDPKNFYGSTLDHDNVKADMVTTRIEHDFSPTLRLVNTTRYGKTTQNYLLTSFMLTTANLVTVVPTNPQSWNFNRTSLTVKDQANEIVTNQTTVTSDFATGALKHTVVAGLELTNEKQKTYGYAATGSLPTTSLYHPDFNLPASVRFTRTAAFTDGSTGTQSVYAFDTLKLGSDWIFNGGVRFDHYSTDYAAVTLSTAAANPTLPVGTAIPTKLELSDTLVNAKLSALYKPTKDSSVYALVASSKAPPGGTNFGLSTSASSAANPKFDPQETITTELGTKWDFLASKLSLSAALYRTTVKNEVEQDPIDLLYYQTGKKRVQGIEVGVIGEVMRNWLVSAGYTRMDTKVESGKVVTASGENALSYTPKQAATLWTSYTLPMGLKIGGGVRYQDKLLRGTDGAVGTPQYANGYTVVDAFASYSFTKNVDLQLNVYNLTDKAYVGAINKSGYRYTPGAPRSGSVSINVRF
jgi:catecholate siderophore receptor